MLDLYRLDKVFSDYEGIRNELELFSKTKPHLNSSPQGEDEAAASFSSKEREFKSEVFMKEITKKEEIIVFSKADLLDDEMREHIVQEFSEKFPNKKYFIISAATGQGLEEMKDYLTQNVISAGALAQEEKIEREENDDGTVVFDLHSEDSDPKRTSVEYEGDMIFTAS
jgi:GTP-binding protein